MKNGLFVLILGYFWAILFARRMDLGIFKAVFCENPKIARRRRFFLKNGLFVLILGNFWAIVVICFALLQKNWGGGG